MGKITIFTATYNREKLLYRLYESLKMQTVKGFEWLIIDDDSTDNTNYVVNKWINKKNDFSIRYIKQTHGGKHRALNRGFVEANGEYFFIVDSDDYLTNNAIELINSWINNIESSNEKLAGVSGLIAYKNGIINGGIPLVNNNGWIDADCKTRRKYNLEGDKAEVFKTKLLRKHPFPEFDNEFFITDSVCWNAIYLEGYKIRWFNKVIYIAEYLEDGLTKSGMNEFNGNLKNYYGFCYFVRQSINIFGTINQPRLIWNYFKISKIKGLKIKNIKRDLKMSNIELIYNFICIPLGFIKSTIRILKNEGVYGVCKRLSN